MKRKESKNEKRSAKEKNSEKDAARLRCLVAPSIKQDRQSQYKNNNTLRVVRVITVAVKKL